MDRRAQLSRWARRLAELASAGDWPAIAMFDRRLANELQLMSSQGPWNDTERSALDALRHVHETTRKRCQYEMDRLSGRMEAMRSHKSAWMAYAMNEQDEV